MAKSGTLKAHEDKTRKTRKFGEVKLHKRTSKGVFFVAWCQSEGIHEMTGGRRRDLEIAVIEQHLIRGGSPNAQTGNFRLPVDPVFEHISDNIAADASKGKGRTFERDRDTVFAKEATLSVWGQYRAAKRRRAREAKKREAA
ncbi:hypothetical protein J2Y48_004718 [Mycoplana sp. BE70]|uniref:hypothetical protein n=1 Tax=Mycoplana sp. BE70 TaxID=2817775 RepID=UPI002861E242|nr:hypothetical protein [Mycoplana sp. BE70]MDR6759402.1 hypothetical protein [Mycoplana sp. BE70]